MADPTEEQTARFDAVADPAMRKLVDDPETNSVFLVVLRHDGTFSAVAGGCACHGCGRSATEVIARTVLNMEARRNRRKYHA